MNFKKILPLLLAATLAAPAYAFDSSDPFGMGDAQVEKVAKAPREKNTASDAKYLVKSGATGFALAFLPPIGALLLPVTGVIEQNNQLINLNAFYAGAAVRGKVKKVWDMSGQGKVFLKNLHSLWGLDTATAPSVDTIGDQLVVLDLDVDGPTDSDRFAIVRKGYDYQVGDIVDAKTLVGTYAFQPKVNKDVKLDFNKHMPRVIALYCKHDQPCQNDYESSLGVLYRHQDKEFPVSQYLIDPAIIAADQAKMRKEAEETKTASNNGSFSFF